MGPSKEYGRILRDMRVSAGLSLRDAARVVGLSDVEYGAVERGARSLDVALEHRLVGHVLIHVARTACAASDSLDEHGKGIHCACNVPGSTEAVAALRGDDHE